MDDHGTIWNRLDEHGNHLHELRTRVSDLASRQSAYDADVRAMKLQMTDMRENLIAAENKHGTRHEEVMRRLSELAAAKAAGAAVREYRRGLFADVAKWVAVAVTVLIAIGLIGKSAEAMAVNFGHKSIYMDAPKKRGEVMQ
jgi:hypothetical protein